MLKPRVIGVTINITRFAELFYGKQGAGMAMMKPMPTNIARLIILSC
jgi:hypothetical protein